MQRLRVHSARASTALLGLVGVATHATRRGREWSARRKKSVLESGVLRTTPKCRTKQGRRYRKLHDRMIGKTVRSTTSTTRPDPFVKHTGAARRSPLLLLLFTPAAVAVQHNARARTPKLFSRPPSTGAAIAWTEVCGRHNLLYPGREPAEGRGERRSLPATSYRHFA